MLYIYIYIYISTYFYFSFSLSTSIIQLCELHVQHKLQYYYCLYKMVSYSVNLEVSSFRKLIYCPLILSFAPHTVCCSLMLSSVFGSSVKAVVFWLYRASSGTGLSFLCSLDSVMFCVSSGLCVWMCVYLHEERLLCCVCSVSGAKGQISWIWRSLFT